MDYAKLFENTKLTANQCDVAEANRKVSLNSFALFQMTGDFMYASHRHRDIAARMGRGVGTST